MIRKKTCITGYFHYPSLIVHVEIVECLYGAYDYAAHDNIYMPHNVDIINLLLCPRDYSHNRQDVYQQCASNRRY